MTAPRSLGAVGHYNLLERLEPSGPGDLYRARDTRLGRTVLVRLLPDGFPAAADGDKLVEQARSMITLSHPNVTLLFDAGIHQGRVFLVSEYLKGQSLRAEMAGRPMNVRRALEVAIQIADGVAEAHAAGFIHGGLSPDSMVITAKGRAKVPSFELAARSGFEDAGGQLRLRDYLSPEEANGLPPDDRSDVYSIGSMLYEMLTAKRPSLKGAAAPSAANRLVGKEVDAVVLRAVAPNPQLRQQSVASFAAELRDIATVLDARGIGSDDDEAADRQPATGSRTIVLALVVLGAIAGFIWWSIR